MIPTWLVNTFILIAALTALDLLLLIVWIAAVEAVERYGGGHRAVRP